MHKAKKRGLSIMPMMLCLVAMLVTACGSAATTTSTTKAPASKQVFTFPLDGYSTISTFDPALSTDFASNTAIQTVFTGLVQLDDNLNVRPQLATSWEESSDGLTYTFHLKPNLKFSDGTPLTSKDVAYSIDRALQPAVKSVTSPTYLGLVKDAALLNTGKIKTIIGDSLKTPDDNTIIIQTSKKAAYFLESLTYSCSYVVEKSLVDQYGNLNFTDHLTQGGGDGPWKVQEFNHSSGITLVPNPDYYGPKPQLSKLIIPFYKDVATGYKAYQAGQADFATVPIPDLASAEAKTGEFHKVPQLWINYYGLNYLSKPFDNIHIRQALDLALNKDEIAHAVWKDVYTATNHIVPKGMPGYDTSLNSPDGTPSTKGNQALAKKLLEQGLAEEGYKSVSQLPSITLSYPTGSTDTSNDVNAAIQSWQSVLNINVKGNAIDFSKLVDEINGTPGNASLQMWYIAWIADYPDPQDWLTLQFDKGAPNNNSNYGQNKVSDAADQQANQQAMEQADGNQDPTSRMSAYNAAEQKLVNDVAWLPTNQVNAPLVLKTYVVGLTFNAELLTPPDNWSKVYIASH